MSDNKPVLELELYLIRHGESRGNVRKSSDGFDKKELTDPGLTEKGLAQADALGKHLKDICFDGVFASGLVRAVETATGILRYKDEDINHEILPQVSEVGVGAEYTGATLDELRAINKNTIMAQGVDHNGNTVMPSDSADEEGLYKRAQYVIEYLRKRYNKGETIAVVSHAAFITYIVFHIMGFDKAPLFDINFFNTGITKIKFYKEGTNHYGDIVFDYLNNTQHLV